MKLSITTKYLDELKESFGEGDQNNISAGYGFQQKALSFMPTQYVILADSEKLTLVILSGITLNVKSTVTYTRSDLKMVKSKWVLAGRKFVIIPNEGKKIKFRMSKTVFGITKYQKDVIEKLNNFSSYYS